MANKRIDQLNPNLETLSGSEMIPIFDTNTNTTERITVNDLSEFIGEDIFTTGTTLNGGIIEYHRNDISNAYSTDLTPILSGFSTTDTFVTGGTYNSLTTSLDFSGNTGFNPFSVDVSSLGGGSDYTEITYSELQTLQSNDDLSVGATYHITDRDIWLTALSTSELSIEGKRLMRIVKNVEYTVAGNSLGVWNTTLSPIIGNTAIWGGKVWTNILGNVGTSVDDRYLDPLEWEEVVTTDDTYYEDKVFSILYDFDNDWVSSQSDDRDNTFGISFVYATLASIVYNFCDISDWGNEYIFDNKVWGIFNNSTSFIVGNYNFGFISNNSAGVIAGNRNNGIIKDNSDPGQIIANTNNGEITNNSTAGGITYNSNDGIINGNTNSGVIEYNSNNGSIEANSNSGFGNIRNNSNNGSIIGNSNSGQGITDNSNNGYIVSNSNNGTINGNLNNGYIHGNTHGGSILRNSNNGVIEINSNVGVINYNSNGGPIHNNTQTSGTCNITNNNNNGTISGARVADVIGVIVNI
jgi:hypothetical protein